MSDFATTSLPSVKIDATPTGTFKADVIPGDVPAHGLVGATPKGGPTALPAGSSHLTLPEWLPSGGPMVVPLLPHSGGSSILTGMGTAPDIVEYPLIGAVLILVAQTIAGFTTSANDTGSPPNKRFAAAVTVNAGSACAFVCGEVAGEKKWFPLFAVAP